MTRPHVEKEAAMPLPAPPSPHAERKECGRVFKSKHDVLARCWLPVGHKRDCGGVRVERKEESNR